MKHYYVKFTQTIKRQNAAVKDKALTPIKRSLLAVKQGLAQESRETKVMLSTYKQFTLGKATTEEMEEANKQFVDVVRGLGLGVLAVLPFSPITLPFVVKLGEKLGVNVLPSAFTAESQVEEVIEIQEEIDVIVEPESESSKDIEH